MMKWIVILGSISSFLLILIMFFSKKKPKKDKSNDKKDLDFIKNAEKLQNTIPLSRVENNEEKAKKFNKAYHRYLENKKRDFEKRKERGELSNEELTEEGFKELKGDLIKQLNEVEKEREKILKNKSEEQVGKLDE